MIFMSKCCMYSCLPRHALNVQIKASAKVRDSIDAHQLHGEMKRAESFMDPFRKDIKRMKDKMRIIDDMLEFGVELCV